jgi:hypothetical protein
MTRVRDVGMNEDEQDESDGVPNEATCNDVNENE